MFAAISRLLPAAAKFGRQIVPPVIATLIAAGLISGYNRAFSGHLQQPRMAALHQDAPEPAKELAVKPLTPSQAVAVYDTIAPPPRLWEKEPKQESGKDQAIKVAEPAPVRPPAVRAEKVEPRAEHRRVAAVEQPPVVRAPSPVVTPAPLVVAVPPPFVGPPAAAPVVSSMPTVQELRQPVLPPPPAQPHYQQPQYGQPQYQHPQYAQPQYQQPQYQQPPYQPPPVITAQPVVTVPDRTRPVVEAQAEAPNAPQGPLGRIVDTLKPSNLFARAREFGERIEQAGNDILPNIRQ